MAEKRQSDDEFLKIARKRWARAVDAESKNRALALIDLRFKSGDQWDPAIKQKRLAEERPCLTINKMKTFVHQVTNDQRQNRPAISVIPVGDKGNKQTAEMLKGLIRAIERQSGGEIAYDTGFDNAVSNGFGYWRIITDYEGEDSFDQCIKIMRVRNPFTVYLDPDRQQPDGSDAKWGFVTEMMPREEFEEQWPNADKLSWDSFAIGDSYRGWYDEKAIRIAEYFLVETETKNLVKLANGHIGYKEDLAPEILAKVNADPTFVLDERKVECREVNWYKITGKEILEEQEWPGKWIPIVEVVGDEIDIEGQVIRSGVIRDAIDPQRMKNYWSSAMTERVALESKSPWIAAEGQTEGYEEQWDTANTVNRNVLIYRPQSLDGKPLPPPSRPGWMGPPAGVMAAEAQSEQDMMATTGIRFDATKSERIQDESGIALKQLHSNQQLGAFHYLDNQARSLKHTGRIILDLAPCIYSTKRVMTIINDDDSESMVMLNPQQGSAVGEEEYGEGTIKCYNLGYGKYDVAVSIGPNYQTKMQEASESMMNFGKFYPEAARFTADLVAKNQPWPGSDEIARRLAMTLPPEMLLPAIEGASPEVQALVLGLQKQIQQLQQQAQHLASQVMDKSADREVDVYKINKDFEAKMTKIFEDAMESKMEHFREMVLGIRALEQESAKPNGEAK